MKIRDNPKLEEYIKIKMERGWTPEEIVERLKTENEGKAVISFKLIYNWLETPFGEPHKKYLASKQSHWRRRKVGKKVIIRDRVFIEDRPTIINKRKRLRDFEADVLGSLKSEKARIAGIVDRKAKYLNLKKVSRLREAVIAYNRMLKTGNAQSCTMDNGPENASWKRFRIPTYFCHPYSPYEKGTVENTFQRLRRFIPKKSRLSQYSDDDISIIVDKMNNTPRKCLNWKTPNEVFFNLPIEQSFDDFNYSPQPFLNLECCASG
jgi:IS30 family transposase